MVAGGPALTREYFETLGFGTFVELFEARAAQHADRPFLSDGERTLTYREVAQRVERIAAGLRELGVRPGGFLPGLLPNSIEFVLAWFATVRLGAGFAPLNHELVGDSLAHQFEDTGAPLAVVAAPYLDRLPPRSGVVHRLIVVGDGDGAEPAAGPPGYELTDWRDLLSHTGPTPPVAATPSSPYLVMYSSGTTGRSKGVLGIHSSELYKARLADVLHFGPDDVAYLPLPLYHGLAMGIVHLTLWAGARIVIAPRFSASGYWDDIRRHGCTFTGHVGSLLEILLRQPATPADRDHPLRLSFGVGATAESWTRIRERFGFELCEFYGSTETGLLTFNTPPGLVGSVGRSCERVDMRLVDEEDRDVPDGEVGELIARPTLPETMAPGYIHAAFTNDGDWYRTGDLLRRDAGGNYFFVGRSKDTIRRRGQNIVPDEVERAANRHPAVLASAAVPVPSELGEDEVKLCVQLRPGATVSPEALTEHMVSHLAAYMLPRYIRFVDTLPYTGTHKLQRQLLRGTIEPDCWDRLAAAGQPAERRG